MQAKLSHSDGITKNAGKRKDNAVWVLFADSERPSNARFIYGHFYQLL